VRALSKPAPAGRFRPAGVSKSAFQTTIAAAEFKRLRRQTGRPDR